MRFVACILMALLLGAVPAQGAAATNAVAEIGAVGSSAAVSVLRMAGALCIVFGVFFGGTWLFKNWSRFNPARNAQRKLQVLEAKSLGARQSVCVIGYDKQRFLVGTSPQGISLISHLPEGEEQPASSTIIPLPFTEALMQALGRK